MEEALQHGSIKQCITDHGTQFIKTNGKARFWHCPTLYSLILHATDKRNNKVDFSKIKEKLGFIPNFKITDVITEISTAFQENKVIDYLQPVYHNHKFLHIVFSNN